MKCHSPIMVSVAVYAMRYATGPELPRGLSFGVDVGGRREGQRKKCALVIWLLYELGGGKFEVLYTYNGE